MDPQRFRQINKQSTAHSSVLLRSLNRGPGEPAHPTQALPSADFRYGSAPVPRRYEDTVAGALNWEENPETCPSRRARIYAACRRAGAGEQEARATATLPGPAARARYAEVVARGERVHGAPTRRGPGLAESLAAWEGVSASSHEGDEFPYVTGSVAREQDAAIKTLRAQPQPQLACTQRKCVSSRREELASTFTLPRFANVPSKLATDLCPEASIRTKKM